MLKPSSWEQHSTIYESRSSFSCGNIKFRSSRCGDRQGFTKALCTPSISHRSPHIVVIFPTYFIKGLKNVHKMLKLTIKPLYPKKLQALSSKHVLVTHSQVIYKQVTYIKLHKLHQNEHIKIHFTNI